MISFKEIEKMLESLQLRNDNSLDSEKIRDLIQKKKKNIFLLNQMQCQLNKDSSHGSGKDRKVLKALSNDIKLKKNDLSEIEKELEKLFFNIPNVLKSDVPHGQSSLENIKICVVGQKTYFNFIPKTHEEIGNLLDILDFKKSSEISGPRFVFFKKIGVLLYRALYQYFCDFHISQGDIEIFPPYLVKSNALYGTGQLPKFNKDIFKVVIEDNARELYLIPTAEVPVTNYHLNEIVDVENPIRYCAYSSCFRAEAGASGRDSNGLIRLHQFEKVELVRFCKEEDAEKEFNLMVIRVSKILSNLGLPHRLMFLCTGDTGFSASKTYDLEVWFPSQNKYREVSSCSDFGTFQASRSKIRYRDKYGKKKFVTTLNGSGLPLGRIFAAILENNQTRQGTVNIPMVLQPYMKGIMEIK
ncbi:MAG: serine--tRNA ligase [Deltaproteobacteria bacterium]|nr:MAG: serine--tRNA ligase [Deltaproteobacteria bacterium]